MNLTDSIKRTGSGLRSTKKLSAEKLLGNRSQFLLSQSVAINEFSPGMRNQADQTLKQRAAYSGSNMLTDAQRQPTNGPYTRIQAQRDTQYTQ